MSENRQIFTLNQVVSSIRKTIEERYQKLYWVKAEMHKLNQFASGHCFPELLQKEDGKIIAQISGTIWKHQFERINANFIKVVKEPLKEDSTLLIQVKINFHELYGLSLQIMDIDPNYSLGELQKERQETLKRLEKEGILNSNQQLSFPLLPKRIAIISADSSKGLSDFTQIIENNNWGYSFFTMLFPAYLQGDNAANSIIHQLRRIEKVKAHFDIVVIVRGGGGEVGLSCYNNFELCKSIATFPLPILTGIGHSTNLTVAEMVSYRNAITPTELGEFLLQAFHNFSVPLKEHAKNIRHFSNVLLKTENTSIRNITKFFVNNTGQLLYTNQLSLNSTRKELINSFKFSFQKNKDALRETKRAVYSNSNFSIATAKAHLLSFETNLSLKSKAVLYTSATTLESYIQSVRLLDPIHVLNRGYSITMLNGKSIGIENRPQAGDKIISKTANFEINSEVVEIKKQENE